MNIKGRIGHELSIVEQLESENTKLRACLESCYTIQRAHCEDLNPHKDLKRGESADFDAALDHLARIAEALAPKQSEPTHA